MASKRALRRRQCDRKVRHPTYQAAESEARRLSGVTCSWVVPYRCSHCGFFHTGHPPARVRHLMQARRGDAPRRY